MADQTAEPDSLTPSTFQVPARAKRAAQERASREHLTLSEVVRASIVAYGAGRKSVIFPPARDSS